MSLRLGKMLDRNYQLRLPFLDGHYNIGLFFNKSSPFLLFSIDSDFSSTTIDRPNVKINMYKSLIVSKFCETFLVLHNYKNDKLDIVNQFENLKDEYFHDVNMFLNERVTLLKYEVDDKFLYDLLNIYTFTLNSYIGEFIFVIAERQFINKKINRKIVRSNGLQIATSASLELIDRYHKEDYGKGNLAAERKPILGKTINFMEEEKIK